MRGASGRDTSLACFGGARAPAVAARNVGHGSFPGSAQSPSRRKKQSSQVAGGRRVFVMSGRSPLVDQGAHSVREAARLATPRKSSAP